jgi:polyphosphate glucokinase
MTAAARKPTRVLVVDVGGTHLKVRVTGQREERKIPSDAAMTATRMMRDVKHIVKDWKYDVISIVIRDP